MCTIQALEQAIWFRYAAQNGFHTNALVMHMLIH